MHLKALQLGIRAKRPSPSQESIVYNYDDARCATSWVAFDAGVPASGRRYHGTYLLNPARYSEDSLRKEHIKMLVGAGDWFQDLEQTCYTTDLSPSHARVQAWLQKTRLPYDPFESAIVSTERDIACPRCPRQVNVRLADSNGTGYLQQDFKTTCTGTNAVLAGTLHTPDNIENTRRAKVIKAGILNIYPPAFRKGDAKTEEEWVLKIQKQMDYILARVSRTCPSVRMTRSPKTGRQELSTPLIGRGGTVSGFHILTVEVYCRATRLGKD
ncbi:hypothetical protein IW262DRAFT_1453031 [Armillaria fumosa]|nr:hypothetical protein IW262DRAFT_1453031 [Armillaria fumosa]